MKKLCLAVSYFVIVLLVVSLSLVAPTAGPQPFSQAIAGTSQVCHFGNPVTSPDLEIALTNGSRFWLPAGVCTNPADDVFGWRPPRGYEARWQGGDEGLSTRIARYEPGRFHGTMGVDVRVTSLYRIQYGGGRF